MARIRTIKPEFFRHSKLYVAEQETKMPMRIAFAGLWTVADREGRFRWRPEELKLDCLPYDDLEFADVLDALERHGFVKKYSVAGEEYGCIPTWSKHQAINTRESPSKLPDPAKIKADNDMHVHAHASAAHDNAANGDYSRGINVPGPVKKTVLARDGNKCLRCGAVKQLTMDHIFPRSMGGTHAITNLRTLCRSCNSARPVAGKALIDDLARDGLTINDMQRICMIVDKHVHAHAQQAHAQGEGEREREQGSEAKASGGKPPDPGPLDLQKELWSRGVSFLKANGVDEKHARPLIGKWRKSAGRGGDYAVLQALASAEAEAVSEPIAFIEATLMREKSNGRANGTGQPGHGSEVAYVFVERYLAARAQREASRQ